MARVREERGFRAAVGVIARLGAPWVLVPGGCGESLPPLPGLDASYHARCSGAPPQAVDASAAEIQCRVDYVLEQQMDGVAVDSEQEMGVLGLPICCEVCAVKGTADDVCETTCKHDLCSRARDYHVMAGQDLNQSPYCEFSDCGFSFESCMGTDLLHIQGIAIQGEDLPVFYGLLASCNAHADDPARPDGLFTYLEALDGVPGASGALANVDDVVGYCLDLQASAAGTATSTPPDSTSTAASTTSIDVGADSTGAGSTTSEGPGPGMQNDSPTPCGPWAAERFWVRPSNNFGAWDETSGGVDRMADVTHEIEVTGGGIAYTLFPCGAEPDAECIRIDQLSLRWVDAGSGLVASVSTVNETELLPVLERGSFDVPPGALRMTLLHDLGDEFRELAATNAERAQGRLDVVDRTLHIESLGVDSVHREPLATLVLTATLSNSQPRTEIIATYDPIHGSPRLTARTTDADRDPIVHRWMIPGFGSWRGDAIAPILPAGRHAVILHAEDVHRSRGVAARWLEVPLTAAY